MSDSPTLKEQLGVEPARPRVIAECVTLIDAQVKAKSGISGVAIKGAYGTIKRIKKRFVPEVIDGLLDDWLDKLEPYYVKWSASGAGTFSEYITARSDEVSEDLLSVTDERAETSKHKTARKLYKKMRGSAKNNVQGAIPDLGKLVERHMSGEAAAEAAAEAEAAKAESGKGEKEEPAA